MMEQIASLADESEPVTAPRVGVYPMLLNELCAVGVGALMACGIYFLWKDRPRG